MNGPIEITQKHKQTKLLHDCFAIAPGLRIINETFKPS